MRSFVPKTKLFALMIVSLIDSEPQVQYMVFLLLQFSLESAKTH